MSERTKAPCTAKHPTTDRACMKPRGHAGMHHSSGPGYSDQWQTDIDIDQHAAAGGRVRLVVGEISIERSER